MKLKLVCAAVLAGVALLTGAGSAAAHSGDGHGHGYGYGGHGDDGGLVEINLLNDVIDVLSHD
ncbi:hypothetical protein ACIO93_29815 [Streptomyces sp. NPDC087903]|uniref:hypothetical protein n=1 Tax=Streptomyces sp. NPDC087903 TaxID=3365819 RepID=UPI0037F41279